MTALDAALAAYAFRAGRAQRCGNYRHRRLISEPIALVAWQLGGEPFAVAACAYGTRPDSWDGFVIPGQPLDRRLLFPALEPLAEWFNQRFELPWGDRVEVIQGKKNPRTVERAQTIPQLLVPNPGAVKLLRYLGRRLAYLPTEAVPDGPPPAPASLVRFGRHLLFLARHFREPGQQLVIDGVSLCTDNWITPQTVGERANLGALDAWIEPPANENGFDAAAQAEAASSGPIPVPDDEDRLAKYMTALDETRDPSDPAALDPGHLADIADFYRRLTEPAWSLMWRVFTREAAWPEEPRFTEERVGADIEMYSEHMSWMDGAAGGRRRTRDSVRQAIRARRQAENASQRLEAQEACSDPVRMIPYLLDHKAVEGEVVSYDGSNKEVKPGNKIASAVPLVTIRTTFPSLIPPGKTLWWTEEPARVKAVVESVMDDVSGPGSLVQLKVMDGAAASAPIGVVETVCFSTLTTKTHDWTPMPPADPFTHIPAQRDETTAHIEPEGDRS